MNGRHVERVRKISELSKPLLPAKRVKKIKLDTYNFETIASKYGLRNYFLQDLDKVKEHTSY